MRSFLFLFLLFSFSCKRGIDFTEKTKLQYMPSMVNKFDRPYIAPPPYSVSLNQFIYPDTPEQSENLDYCATKSSNTLKSPKDLYNIACSHCHGKNGDGKSSLKGFPPGTPLKYSYSSDNYIFFKVVTKTSPIMPSLKDKFSPDDICQIIKHIRFLQGKKNYEFKKRTH